MVVTTPFPKILKEALMDNQRLIFFVIISFSILFLWESWQKDRHPIQPPTQLSQSVPPQTTAQGLQSPVEPISSATTSTENKVESLKTGKRIKVQTDVFQAEIDTIGGDIRGLELVKHREAKPFVLYEGWLELLRHRGAAENAKPFVLYQDNSAHTYIAQSGFTIGDGLPNHKMAYTAQAEAYNIAENQNQVEVKLNWVGANGILVEKTYTFHKGSYLIDVGYEISNHSGNRIIPHVYYQFLRDKNAPQGDPKFVSTYTGAAVYTDKEKFEKVDFSDIDKGKEKYPKLSNDGWIAMLQHYFFSAWLPSGNVQREFFTKKIGDLYAVGMIVPVGPVEAGTKQSTKMALYAGPQEQEALSKLAPGLDLVVDYGWLTVIAAPLFWIVQLIYKLVQNWGVSIILLTVLIKVAFYPLSAKSYQSMAAMRLISPKLQKLKEQYGDDRQRLHQAMMDLYKAEKINPLGGCLPVIVQMPVFIALYWVLLYSVEMRQAPFMAWIQDMSAPDPYCVLPIIMGLTMIVQAKLNPTPPDPIQAKVMMMMPIIFSVFFFFFPAGLVLYWVVNNTLSIAQQWHITRSLERASAAKGHG
jgi:YidC/Oxa1 family membrane protein insertase